MHSPRTWLRAAAIFFFSGLTCWADWTNPVNFTNLPDYEVGPRAARDSNGRIHFVWYGGAPESTGWQIFYQQWTTGTGWSAPVAISGTGAASPGIAIDSANNLHVVWHGGGNPEEVFYRKATGGVWGAVTNLSTSPGRSLNPRVAVNGAGTAVLVTWHESNQTAGDWDILARPFAGSAWLTAENVSADSGLSRFADVVCDGGGNFHVAWEDLGTRNLFYRRRAAAGGYGTKTALDTTAGRSFGAALAVAPNGTIHAAWHDEDGDWEIMHRCFNGTAWGALTNLSNHIDPDHADNTPNIYCDSNNQVHVLWHDYQSVHYAHTVASVWRPRHALYSGTTTGTGVLVGGATASELHAIFACRDPGTWDCFHAIAAIPDVTPPGPVTLFRATPSSGQNRLEWFLPSARDRQAVRIRWKTTGYPTSPTDGTLLADVANPGFSINHTGLANGTTYYYSAFAYDAEPNYSTAAQSSGTPTIAPKGNLLVNGPIESAANGIATGWVAYRVNDPGNALTFTSDAAYFQSSAANPSTRSQAIGGLESANLPATGYTAAGLRQTVTATPGKVYLFSGYQDFNSTDFAPAGRRYVHDFGINVTGGTDPGTLNFNGSIGGAKWITAAQALTNDNGGSAQRFGGFHRARAAFVAQASAIAVWTGFSINNAGPREGVAMNFHADANYLFEFDFPIEPALQNGGFEGSILDLQDDGDTLPDKWLPAGGGVGSVQTWACGTASGTFDWTRSGSNGVRIWSRRGTVNAGLMQRVGAVPGANYTFSVYGATSGQDGTTMSVGLDPLGGGDLHSPSIVWTNSTASNGTRGVPNTLVSVAAAAQSSAITVFLRTMSTNATGTSNYQWSDFDDAQLVGTSGGAVLVARGATWRYFDADVDLGTAWRAANYDDAAWPDGPAQLGYGEQDEGTPINDNGGTPRPMCAYFRHRFSVTNPAQFAALSLSVLRDDGAVIYLNGVEIWRTNMLAGYVARGTPAASVVAGTDESTFFSTSIEPGLLVAGENVLAVEVHQQADTSSDLSFDLELTGSTGNPDTDNDGLPDAWENVRFGSLAEQANGDPDGDGMTNAAEHAARTNPRDPDSKFIITSIAATGGAVTVTWPTHAGLRYRIRYGEDLPEWTTLETVFTGTGGIMAWTDDGIETGTAPGSEPRRFYQVVAQP